MMQDSVIAPKEAYDPYKALAERIIEMVCQDAWDEYRSYYTAKKYYMNYKKKSRYLQFEELTAINMAILQKAEAKGKKKSYLWNGADLYRKHLRRLIDNRRDKFNDTIKFFSTDWGMMMCGYTELNLMLAICTPPMTASFRAEKEKSSNRETTKQCMAEYFKSNALRKLGFDKKPNEIIKKLEKFVADPENFKKAKEKEDKE